MKKPNLKMWLALSTVNVTGALMILLGLLLIVNKFEIDGVIHYIDENTKRFLLFTFVISLVLSFIYKWELMAYSWLKQKTLLLAVLKTFYIIVVFSLAALVTNYLLQYFHHLMNAELAGDWIVINTKIFLAGALFLLLITVLLYALTGNLYTGVLLTLIPVLILGFVHYNKLNLRVEPLYPSDFKQITQMKDVIPMVMGYLSWSSVTLVVIAVLGVILLIKYLPNIKIPIWSRLVILVVSAFFIYSIAYFQTTFMKEYVEKANIFPVKWDQLQNYQINGPLFGFLSNLKNETFEKPDGYSKQKVLSIAKKYTEVQNEASIGSSQQPNVVFLMSEAFWDPTIFSTVQFSEDPIKNVRELSESFPSGKLFSPAFGGATANVEFEALTGFTMSALKVGTVPYQEVVDNKVFIPSIVSMLETKGYKSLAIHPYNKAFYKRSKVYDIFGFDRFLDMNTMSHKEKSGPYISDESLSYEILDELKQEEKSLFIHAVSVANHFPYGTGRYDSNTINVSGLSDAPTKELEEFSEGTKRADVALRLLVDELNKIDEPTIVVFWGDHLPILGASQAVYKEAGFENQDEDSVKRQYAETPLLIFANYQLTHQELPSLSSSFLGPLVFEIAGLEKDPYYQLLDAVRAEIPGLRGDIKIGADNRPIRDLTEQQKELLKDYTYIQYDLLVGKQYSKSILFKENGQD